MMFKNGVYQFTADNGKKETTGFNQESKRDKSGNEVFTGGQSFGFNDIDLDRKDLVSGKMTLTFLSKTDVNDVIEQSGVRSQSVFSRWSYAANQSNGGKMDYLIYNQVSKGALNIINGVGYNDHDAGNYLWGYGMGTMGFTSIMARAAAQANVWWSGKESNGESSKSSNHMIRWFENRSWTGDAAADQKAIQKGLNDAGSYIKYKIRTIKMSWE